MIYYFVQHDGRIETEDNVAGYYSKEVNPNMFTSHKAAVKEARAVLKEYISGLQEDLVALDIILRAMDKKP